MTPIPDPLNTPPKITPAKITVSILLFIAAGLTIGLFMIPGTSPYFWPIVAALIVVGVAAMLVPIKPRG